MNIEKRQEIERKIVRHLIRTMKAKGWDISRIDDGGEPDEDAISPNETEAMEVIFSVDEATIYFHKRVTANEGMTHFAMIVLGNDGWDCIADNSCSSAHPMDDFGKIMTEEVDPYCEGFEA